MENQKKKTKTDWTLIFAIVSCIIIVIAVFIGTYLASEKPTQAPIQNENPYPTISSPNLFFVSDGNVTINDIEDGDYNTKNDIIQVGQVKSYSLMTWTNLINCSVGKIDTPGNCYSLNKSICIEYPNQNIFDIHLVSSNIYLEPFYPNPVIYIYQSTKDQVKCFHLKEDGPLRLMVQETNSPLLAEENQTIYFKIYN